MPRSSNNVLHMAVGKIKFGTISKCRDPLWRGRWRIPQPSWIFGESPSIRWRRARKCQKVFDAIRQIDQCRMPQLPDRSRSCREKAILITDQGTCLKFCSSPRRLSEGLFNRCTDGTRGRFLVFFISDSLTRFLSQRAQPGAKHKPQ